MKKVLRLGEHQDLPFRNKCNWEPDEEGIETSQVRRSVLWLWCNWEPDEEGIETAATLHPVFSDTVQLGT